MTYTEDYQILTHLYECVLCASIATQTMFSYNTSFTSTPRKVGVLDDAVWSCLLSVDVAVQRTNNSPQHHLTLLPNVVLM